jgi:predicted DNA-binding transcriptional regulator YafY
LHIAYYDTVRLLAAWFGMRQDFRHFRTDRVTDAEFLEERYSARRDILRSQWRKSMEADVDSRGPGGTRDPPRVSATRLQ